MAQEVFGKINGNDVYAYTLTNKNGMSIKVLEYGAILMSIKVPTKNGDYEELTLGYDTLEEYLQDSHNFGVTVGRYANRIAQGQFSIDGVTYQLATNNNGNCLHGGFKGFGKSLWKTEQFTNVSVTFCYHSPDNDQGFPGNLNARATYKLTDDNEIFVIYEGETDKTTPISLTNHTYFNLAGAGSGDVLDHEVMIFAEKYVEVDDNLVPTGKLADIKDTMYDFNRKKLGEGPKTLGYYMRSNPHFDGYDICYVFPDKSQNSLKNIAMVIDPKSGRVLEVRTTQPGMQFYTANFLKPMKIANGKTTDKYGGMCLETQSFPDAPNHRNFPNSVLSPGDKYHHETIYRIGYFDSSL